MSASPTDFVHIRHALHLAARALGTTAPNPAVACVIVDRDGHIAGRGWTRPGGRPHAETVALAHAGNLARGGTAYVTLEPCCHHGLTPPCADALADAGITRVVAPIADPDPRVSGGGFARLEQRGIQVTRGVMESAANALNAGFLKRVGERTPLVALKIAQTLDGRIADARGKSQWITSEEARRLAHLLRAQYDAIMVGIGTVIADNPLLTCRLPGLEHRTPIRVVLDTRLQLSVNSRLVQSARTSPVILFTSSQSGGADLSGRGVEIERVAAVEDGLPAIPAVLTSLAERGITRLLVEGGPRVHASFMKSGLADRLHVFTAPRLLGGTGRPAIGPAWQSDLASAPRLRLMERVAVGDDLFETLAFDR